MINGYKLIKDPEPVEVKDPIPLITWAELIKNANIVDPNTKKFTMPKAIPREKIAYDLVNKTNIANVAKSTFKQPTEKV